MSSMHEPMCGNQSLTAIPLCPYFLKPTWVGKNLVSLLAVGVVDDGHAGEF